MSPFSSVMYTHTFWLVWLGQQRERKRESIVINIIVCCGNCWKRGSEMNEQLLLLFQASLFHHSDVWTYLTKLTSWHRLRSFYKAKNREREEHDFFGQIYTLFIAIALRTIIHITAATFRLYAKYLVLLSPFFREDDRMPKRRKTKKKRSFRRYSIHSYTHLYSYLVLLHTTYVCIYCTQDFFFCIERKRRECAYIKSIFYTRY